MDETPHAPRLDANDSLEFATNSLDIAGDTSPLVVDRATSSPGWMKSSPENVLLNGTKLFEGFEETQADPLGGHDDQMDTQVIRESEPVGEVTIGDTQLIAGPIVTPPIDTQPGRDTQVVGTDDTQPLHRDLSDTQQLHPTLNDTQKIRSSPVFHDIADTQVITNTPRLVLGEKSSLEVKTAKTVLAQTQVINTQDNTNTTIESIDLGARPVFSSQGPEVVVTDNETEDISEALLEDSIVNHVRRFGRKRRLDLSPTPAQSLSSDLDDIDSDLADEFIRRKPPGRFVVQSQGSEPDVLRHDVGPLYRSDIVNPNAVFAAYKFKIFPGTVESHGDKVCVVRFAEGTSPIALGDLFLMDIRIGDVVSVRLSLLSYEVTGLLVLPTQTPAISCIRGYNTVHMRRLKTKASDEVVVPLSEVCLELSDLVRHQQLHQLVYEGIDILKENYATYLQLTQIGRTTSTISPKRHTPQVSPRKPRGARRLAVFFECLFFHTGIDDKSGLAQVIEANGGTLVDDEPKEVLGGLTQGSLSGDFLDDYSFGALVAGTHSRSAKYLQALALGWPIVLEAFIRDSIKHNLLGHWSSYLLPAGHSSHLNAIKSLDCYAFRANYDRGTKLSGQLGNNAHLLAGRTAVMVSNSSVTTETSAFVFRAFGARTVWCTSQKEAEQLAGPKTLVYTEKGTKGEGTVSWEWVVQCVISQYVRDLA